MTTSVLWLCRCSLSFSSAKQWIGTNEHASFHTNRINNSLLSFSLKYGDLSLAGACYPRSTALTFTRAQNGPALAIGSDDDSEEDEYVPFAEIRQWKANRPSGFGHAKTYDTALEDKLLAEIEQSQKALAALVNKSKRRTEKDAGKVKDGKQAQQQEEQKQKKVLEFIPSGVNVRIGNLPRKKNIVRDLQASFKGYTGLLHINPVEYGNKNTRDPICKGLAFFEFKNDDVANRFIMKYNGARIVFGKIEKKITCCLACPSVLTDSSFMSSTATTMYTVPRLRIREKGFDLSEVVSDFGVLQHQHMENSAISSVNLGNGYDNYRDNVNGNKEMSGENGVNTSGESGFTSVNENDGQGPSDTRSAQRVLKTRYLRTSSSLNDQACIMVDASKFYEHIGVSESSNTSCQNDLYKDLGKGIHHSDNFSKNSDNFMDANAGRLLENAVNSTSSNAKLGKVDVSKYRGGHQNPQQQGSKFVQDSVRQTLASNSEDLNSMKQTIDSTVLASQAKKQRQKKKGKNKQNSKKEIESEPSNTNTIHGSANRLKKKERNILSDVLVKYGQHAVST